MAAPNMTIVKQSEFQKRRDKVLQHLRDLEYGDEKVENPKAIFFSGQEKTFSNDVHYPFRVNSDFYYLTGFDEPDSAVVLDPNSKHPYTLYVRPKDRSKEIWNGYREGVEGAKKNFKADAACDISEVPKTETFTNVDEFVHKMRSIKSEAEIETMRKANEITIQAHRVLKEIITPGIYEYELQANIESIFKSKGARGWAYPCIVASGKNSCILHYMENKQQIEDESVVLVDAGCEYEYYASDVTRVYPSNNHFNKQQQDLYDVVLAAQNKAIESIKPGITFDETHQIACDVLAEGLKDLNYIKDKNDPEELKKYYMHRTGHSLGLDTHDLGVDRKSAKYEAGMVTTIEPGLYIPEKSIGIRIEDDVLVTKDGYENLTEALEK